MGGERRHNLREFATLHAGKRNLTPDPARIQEPVTPESILEYPKPAPPAGGETLEIAPGVHWLRMPLPFALDHINLWLLEDGPGWTLVDCGIGDDTTRSLWDRIFGGSIAGRPVSRLIVTHHHPDHAGLAAWLMERTGAEFWMAQAEYLAAHAMRDGSAGYGFDNVIAMFTRNGVAGERLALLQQRRSNYRNRVPGFPSSYRRLMEGQTHRIGGRHWRVIMGYGHAPEHAALYCEESGVLISGDMVLPKISTNVSVWANEPEGNPLALFLGSIERYAELPAKTLILPSHGLPFRGLRDRVAQLQEHHRLRLGELQEDCQTPKAAADVLGTLFRRNLDAHQLFFAMGEAMAHLHFLYHEGRLARSVAADGVIRYTRR
jgi:glyoxylase-like metal-dependent hydrolase (beta-lactamase superfamily II)